MALERDYAGCPPAFLVSYRLPYPLAPVYEFCLHVQLDHLLRLKGPSHLRLPDVRRHHLRLRGSVADHFRMKHDLQIPVLPTGRQLAQDHAQLRRIREQTAASVPNCFSPAATISRFPVVEFLMRLIKM